MSIALRVLAATLAVAIVGGNAVAADVTVAGGALDPAITTAEVYIGTPKAGDVPAGAACRLAKAYTDNVQGGRYAELAALFAEDGILMEPSGKTAIGRTQIAEFYQGTIGKMKPNVIAVSYVGDETDCMVAFASQTTNYGAPRFKLTSLDHFTLNAAGKFSRMVAFTRPNRSAPPAPR